MFQEADKIELKSWFMPFGRVPWWKETEKQKVEKRWFLVEILIMTQRQVANSNMKALIHSSQSTIFQHRACVRRL